MAFSKQNPNVLMLRSLRRDHNNKKDCKAKARLEWKGDRKVLDDFLDFEQNFLHSIDNYHHQ